MIKAFWIVNDSKRFFICDFRNWWLAAGPQKTQTAQRNGKYQEGDSLTGNAIKLSGRTFLAPHRGSSPKG